MIVVSGDLVTVVGDKKEKTANFFYKRAKLRVKELTQRKGKSIHTIANFDSIC